MYVLLLRKVAHEFSRHPYDRLAVRDFPDLGHRIRAQLRESLDDVLAVAGVPQSRRVPGGRVLAEEPQLHRTQFTLMLPRGGRIGSDLVRHNVAPSVQTPVLWHMPLKAEPAISRAGRCAAVARIAAGMRGLRGVARQQREAASPPARF